MIIMAEEHCVLVLYCITLLYFSLVGDPDLCPHISLQGVSRSMNLSGWIPVDISPFDTAALFFEGLSNRPQISLSQPMLSQRILFISCDTR